LQPGETNEIIYLTARLCWEASADVELTKPPVMSMTSVNEITDTSESIG
jgi:hypothetical protein